MTAPVPLHTAFFTAVCGLILVSLALRTSLLRGRYGVYEGYGDHVDLQRTSRAHGVSVEHAVPMLLMLLLLELSGASRTEVDTFGAIIAGSRVVHVIGFLRFGRGRVRRAGMTLTYACELALVIALLVRVLRVASRVTAG